MQSDFIVMLANIMRMQNAEAWKVAGSFAVFLTTFLAGIILFYDVIRGCHRKFAGGPWHYSLILTAFAFYAMSVFALARFLDGIQDYEFIMLHPSAVTTLSQQSLVLEIPFIGVAITTFVFIIVYIIEYIRAPYRGQ